MNIHRISFNLIEHKKSRLIATFEKSFKKSKFLSSVYLASFPAKRISGDNLKDQIFDEFLFKIALIRGHLIYAHDYKTT